MTTEKAQSKEIEKSTVLRTAEMDPHFKYELSKVPGSEKLMLCFQCGTCTADCPVASFSSSYRPRQIIRMAQLGLKSEILSSDTLWLCAACFTCTDHCPQNVELADVLRVLRNMAVEEGFFPIAHRELASNILGTGYAYKIPGSRLKKREQLGFPSLPKANLQSIAKLAQITRFSKLIETRRTRNG